MIMIIVNLLNILILVIYLIKQATLQVNPQETIRYLDLSIYYNPKNTNSIYLKGSILSIT